MFRPIKKFITYIQKSASNSTMFGGSQIEAEEVVEEKPITMESDVGRKKSNSKAVTETTPSSHCTTSINGLVTNIETRPREILHIIEVENELNDNETVQHGDASKFTSVTVAESIPAVYDPDDIESQIMSSIIKSPVSKRQSSAFSGVLQNGNASVVLARRPIVMTHAVRSSPPVESHTDYNQNRASPDEFHDTCTNDNENDLQPNNSVEFYPIECDQNSTIVDGVASLEEDDCDYIEETVIDLPADLPTYSDSEIIVINENDINSSSASDSISEDPLAFDDHKIITLSDPIALLESPISEVLLDHANNDDSNEHAKYNNEPEVEMEIIRPNVKKDAVLSLRPQQNKLILKTAASDDVSNSSSVIISKTDIADHTEELRCDGSDSGLGSESLSSALQISIGDNDPTTPTSAAQPTLGTQTQVIQLKPDIKKTLSPLATSNSLPSCSSASTTSKALSEIVVPTSIMQRKPLRSNLKRRYDSRDCLDVAPSASTVATIATDTVAEKKAKRSINFNSVQIFYFPRQQGFGCVPSAGGCTLGMGSQHISCKTISLAEHAAELRRAHRLQLQEINPRGSSSDDSEESEEDYLSEGSGSDLDADSSGFLQPVSPKQRRTILKAAGVRKIDASEKIDCRNIRNSREVCGCTCRDYCDPVTCACSIAGIKCQVDRAMFPCGCSRDGCGNSNGRIEFNPHRVRTHYIHTVMRLEMEQRQQQNPCIIGHNSNTLSYCAQAINVMNPSTLAMTPGTTNGYYAMQTQSNYSSGYASPAYPNEQTANYYQSSIHGAHYNTNQISTQQQQQHQPSQFHMMDTLDSNLFCGTSNGMTALTSYSEMMSSYGAATCNTNCISSNLYHTSQTMGYVRINSEGNPSNENANSVEVNLQSQMPVYSSYLQQSATTTLSSSSSNYLIPTHSNNLSCNMPTPPPPITYSSCAVPSMPPYGTATTTAASVEYHHDRNVILGTTAPSCLPENHETMCFDTTHNTTNGSSSFINLSTPVASSSMLTQINDLLQHNRNSTAALVAVSQTSPITTSAKSYSSSTSTSTSTSTINSICIDAPLIEDVHKNYINFDELALPPLNPSPNIATVPIITVNGTQQELDKELNEINKNDSKATTTSITTTTLNAVDKQAINDNNVMCSSPVNDSISSCGIVTTVTTEINTFENVSTPTEV